MHAIHRIVALMSIASLMVGCGGTVNYNPNNPTPDMTGPTVNLLVSRYGATDVEVQGQGPTSANKSTNFGNPAPTTRVSDFSVLATAKDPESGIKDLKIVMTRTVCFTGSGGGNNGAPFHTVTRKETRWTNPQSAPTSPSLGETGIIDARPLMLTPDSIKATNLLAYESSQGHLRPGVGVATKWGMEATNFAGATTYSDAIYVLAGDVACPALP
jgi:hypothetical protein